MSRPTLSVTVIALNEAHDIGDCLESVRGWADEIIVLDSGSTDGTPDLCRQAGVRVFETDWPGDGQQKNRAIDEARGDWVLSLDADERVGPELRAEIDRILSAGTAHLGFSVPRRSSFCGRFMKHSGWWPDRVERLFKRTHARYSEMGIHDRLEVDGSVGNLEYPLIHLSIRDIGESLEKIHSYSTSGAQVLYEKGKQASLSKAIAHGLWAFIRTYVIRLGMLDGREGFILAVANAEGTYYRYIKLMLLQRNAPRP